MASRLSRTRSTIRRPFSKRAPLTSTWSVSVNWRLNDRAEIPRCRKSFFPSQSCGLRTPSGARLNRRDPEGIPIAAVATTKKFGRPRKVSRGRRNFFLQGLGSVNPFDPSSSAPALPRARQRGFPRPLSLSTGHLRHFSLTPGTKSTKERAPAEPRCLASMFLGGGRRWKRKCVKRER
jgi:hypothetical protein